MLVHTHMAYYLIEEEQLDISNSIIEGAYQKKIKEGTKSLKKE